MGRSFVISACTPDFPAIFVFFSVFNFLSVDKLPPVCLLDTTFSVDFCLDERICWILGTGAGIPSVFIVTLDDDTSTGRCTSFFNALALKVLRGVGSFRTGVCTASLLVILFAHVFPFLVVFVLTCSFLFPLKDLELLTLSFRLFNSNFDSSASNLLCTLCSENPILDLRLLCSTRRASGVTPLIVSGSVIAGCVLGDPTFSIFLVLLNPVAFVFAFDVCVIFLVFDLTNWFWLMLRLEKTFLEVFVFRLCFVWTWRLDFDVKGELNRKLFLEKANVLGFELFNRAPIFFMETVFVGGKNGVGTTINLFREIWALASIRDKYMHY